MNFARRRALSFEIDRERFEVTVAGRAVDLTPKEFELLATLVGAPGRVFRRAKVDLPGVETVRGVGYRFREPEARRS